MKFYKLNCLLLFCLIFWHSANALCSLNTLTSAQCHDLEDARYIDTYQLQDLQAPSSSKYLSPGNFRGLTSLQHLNLSGGEIEIIKNGSFIKLRSLRTLNLAKNHIKHLDTGAFDGLEHLQKLTLENNQIRYLPKALMSLKKLKQLDLSKNPLICNCASLKLRDALIMRGVVLSKTTSCLEQFSTKHSVKSILKPNTKKVCASEIELQEMQGDQPIDSNIESSGDINEETSEVEGENFAVEEEETVPPSNNEYEEVTSSSISTEVSTSSSTEQSPNIAKESTDITPKPDIISTLATTEIIASENNDSLLNNKNLLTETSSETLSIKSEESNVTDVPKEPDESEEEDEDSKELDQSENTEKEEELIKSNNPEMKISTDSTTVTKGLYNVSATLESEKTNIITPDEGSGESEDDGSGSDSSGMISHMPSIDFNETSGGLEDEESHLSSSSSISTTEGPGLFGFLGNLFWGGSDTSESPPSETSTLPTTKSIEDTLREENMFHETQAPPIESVDTVDEPTVPPRVIMQNEAPFNPTHKSFALPNDDIIDNIDPDSSLALDSKESKQGMSSYFVLAALLAILATLIIIAAYKGDFCRKKQKRRDVERGTELKDMQKSLLDQNATHPKIQVSNGTTLENVPLMNSSAPPEEPKDNQKSYDITPAVTNGTSRANGMSTEVNDPVKPPRKSMNHEIEAPLNGLNPPMDDIDGPTSLHNGSNENLDCGSYDDKPPLSPGAQRVKITLQENPDSVPKTPILITRLKGGENLVKTP